MKRKPFFSARNIAYLAVLVALLIVLQLFASAIPMFGVTLPELEAMMEPSRYVGCAPLQTADFLEKVVQPVLNRYEALPEEKPEINV